MSRLLIVLLAVIPLLAITASRASTASETPARPIVAAAPVVIQGQVITLHGPTATVRTPEQMAPCLMTPTPSSTPVACPAIILAGPLFQVDTARAIFETAYGTRAPRSLAVGDLVAIAGTNKTINPSTQVRSLRASVIEPLAASCRAPKGLCVSSDVPSN